MGLILPGHPLFDETLATALPPDWQAVASRINQAPIFVASATDGILRPATPDELTEYLYGGEYDERLDALEPEENELGIFSAAEC
ncbi:hypothetical protein ACQ4M4_05175 [Leptolyngbya sp. AN02str]|uniref:hypothetical protein n=1 Tax=Leptolyngbya sp. AN02str TaxID=3423363 RepID=UPI003D319D0A